MRNYECECLSYHSKQQLAFNEPYPEYGDQFARFCKFCEKESIFTRVLTRKAQAELRRMQDEADRRSAICDYCNKYGYDCRFYLESAIITTPASMWSFNYHDKEKVLRHENRRPVHDDMGGYVKTHEQFRRKASWKEVIDYIYRHDQWRLQNAKLEKKMNDSMTNKIIESLSRNPHFKTLPDILSRESINQDLFMSHRRGLLENLLAEHADDNEGLKEESYNYILPAIATYKALQKFSSDALSIFREMWLNGAEIGAAHLQKKALEEGFLENWIPGVTPKREETGAFLFDIDHVTDIETEYHVLRCPYVQFCQEYRCPEIITVFCDSDDVSFGNIHPRLIWGRTKTIGRGDQFCDFKYTLIEG